MKNRSIDKLVKGQATSDGAGVKLTRVLTHDLQKRLDPFLMLDSFATDNADDYIGGFPDHPHRGFETVTYMIEGRMRHKDNAGNEGLLRPGSVQWMTAGRGIIHSEMPEQENGRMEGFQLWLNLPSQSKMCTPTYKDYEPTDIPVHHDKSGAEVKVIAGEFKGTRGPMQTPMTQAQFYDLWFPQNEDSCVEFELNPLANALIFVYRGEVKVLHEDSTQTIPRSTMAIMKNDGEHIKLSASAHSKAIVIAGIPLSEPIAQYGPFVMNTQEQLHQAVEDFRSGRF
jgi:redox-sensitive bicupin YhaK (pirin superfamily)